MSTLHNDGRNDGRVEVARALALIEIVRSGVTGASLRRTMTDSLEQFGERDVELRGADVDAIAAVCAALSAVLTEPERDRCVLLLNRLLAEHAGPPRLVRHDGWGWHVHVDRSDDAPWHAWLAASAAMALATMLAESAGGVPWGQCGADGCGRLFVHDGRGGERRYCSTTCSSRERVRRHRLRRAQAPAAASKASSSSGGSSATARAATRPSASSTTKYGKLASPNALATE
jgi:predicted RNA-binding Zn ribbon-like protein